MCAQALHLPLSCPTEPTEGSDCGSSQEPLSSSFGVDGKLLGKGGDGGGGAGAFDGTAADEELCAAVEELSDGPVRGVEAVGGLAGVPLLEEAILGPPMVTKAGPEASNPTSFAGPERVGL
mmetsp:Transcript_79435/g.174223  ORF Transcript_79435/g.174223 Transcript_79435/m.174223 type:complete len:121 (-) Transcript_79435:373-735(-)